jgi:hypothetical protein
MSCADLPDGGLLLAVSWSCFRGTVVVFSAGTDLTADWDLGADIGFHPASSLHLVWFVMPPWDGRYAHVCVCVCVSPKHSGIPSLPCGRVVASLSRRPLASCVSMVVHRSVVLTNSCFGVLTMLHVHRASLPWGMTSSVFWIRFRLDWGSLLTQPSAFGVYVCMFFPAPL